MSLHFHIVAALCLGLVACSNEQGDDLDKFMRDAASDMQVKIKPLPEMKPYLALLYNADGMLSDPFRMRRAVNKAGALQPNLNRPKGSLEAYPLENIKYVGLLTKKKLTTALVKIPDNSVQQVKIGDYLGQNFGLVTKISDSEIVLKEIIQDERTSDWVERISSITLQE